VNYGAASDFQMEVAMWLGVSVESCRAWDSGRRIVPLAMQQRAARVHADLSARHEWLPLAHLAREFGVHVSTLHRGVRRLVRSLRARGITLPHKI
jgi:hypothetical protein